MSLYNLLHGQNSNTPFLLELLGIDQEGGKYQSGRFRDIYLNEDSTKIILFTRNGGGNREEYQPLIDELATHPNYITDYDDDFDCTYASIEFSVPEKYQEICKDLASGKKPETLKEKFDNVIKEMEGMSKEEFEKDSRFAPIANMMEKVIDPENTQKVFEV